MRRLRLPIAGLIVALSPGFPAYEAFAGEIRSTGAGLSVLPSVSAPLTTQPGLVNQPSLPSVPVLPSIVIPGAINTAVPMVETPAALPQGAINPQTAIGQVQQTVHAIEQAPAGEQASLNSLYTGRAQTAELGDVTGGGNGSGLVPSSLEPIGVSGLEAIAADQAKPKAERSGAVKALAQRGAQAAASLERVGTGTPATTADDYEVKREALKALADLGKVVSLPAISRAHADQILQDLSTSKKPELAIFDYDSTLEESGTPASAQTGGALEKLAKSGVEAVILTDRAPLSRREGDVGMKQSLEGLPEPQKSVFTVATNRGAQIWIAGMSRLAAQSPKFTPDDVFVIRAAATQMAFLYGTGRDKNGEREIRSDYDYARFLPLGTADARVDEAAAYLGSELNRLVPNRKLSVTPRYGSIDNPPYVTVSAYDKSFGVLQARKLREHLGRLRDVERLPRFLRPLARGIVSIFPKGMVPSKSVLLVGDHFFGARGIDADMVKGAPGALAISVGGTADPRLENTFVWPTTGHAASMELAAASSAPAAPQMEGLDKRAAWGLFTSRSLSIVAFLGTALAHAKLSMGVLADIPGGFGTVGALGALASIAAGPLMGRVADKLSPRKGMTINLVLRGIFLLDMPLFSFFGVLNFWTLLLGSIANGFLLSSIMTSEGAYLRRLFGLKNLGTMNSLLQLNYFALQIVFGLLLGIGKLVDGHNLMIPFLIASAVNFGLIPVIRATMPNTTAAQAAGQAVAPKAPVSAKDRVKAVGSFFKTYWKEALILSAAIATFPVWHSALPITGALVWWITRTDGFKVILADKSVAKGVALVALGAFSLYSVQSFLLPTISKVLAGADSALLNGNMLGALFLGQMVSSASLAKLPTVRLPLIGRFGLQRVIQAAVLAMGAFWVFHALIPGSILAAAATVAIGLGMMNAAGRLTDRGWLSFVGVGLSALVLPAMFWGSTPFLLAGLVAFGFFLGPAAVSLSAYVQRRAPGDKMGAIMGVQGSLFNAAISLGIGTATLITGAFSPAFPPAMWAMAGLGLGAGVIYFLVSRTMPGLSDRWFHTKSKEELK